MSEVRRCVGSLNDDTVERICVGTARIDRSIRETKNEAQYGIHPRDVGIVRVDRLESVSGRISAG